MSGRSPFDGISLLIVDGNNLLHRTAGGPGPSAARVLIPRLRAVMPVGMRVSIVLDGMPDPGAPLREHIGSVAISHAGRRSADDAIVEAVEHRMYDERPGTIVVTDDRGLADRIKRLGALHRRIDWLQDALDLSRRWIAGARLTAGAHRPTRDPAATVVAPAPTARADGAPTDEPERAPWSPGRGATKKRGNPRRGRTPR